MDIIAMTVSQPTTGDDDVSIGGRAFTGNVALDPFNSKIKQLKVAYVPDIEARNATLSLTSSDGRTLASQTISGLTAQGANTKLVLEDEEGNILHAIVTFGSQLACFTATTGTVTTPGGKTTSANILPLVDNAWASLEDSVSARGGNFLASISSDIKSTVEQILDLTVLLATGATPPVKTVVEYYNMFENWLWWNRLGKDKIGGIGLNQQIDGNYAPTGVVWMTPSRMKSVRMTFVDLAKEFALYLTQQDGTIVSILTSADGKIYTYAVGNVVLTQVEVITPNSEDPTGSITITPSDSITAGLGISTTGNVGTLASAFTYNGTTGMASSGAVKVAYAAAPTEPQGQVAVATMSG